MPSQAELVLRLLLASALAGLLGGERELTDQPAGFRTHILVGLGAALFAVISAYGFETVVGRARPGTVQADPTRVASQIVVGIGFLGGGAIIKYGASIRGLTTAASLWVVAAIGLAIGAGAYLISAVTTAVTLLALLALKPLRTRLVRGLRKEHEEFLIEVDPQLEVEGLVHDLGEEGVRVDHFRVEEEDGVRQIVVFLALPPDRRPEDMAGVLARVPGVRNVDWTR